MKCNLPECNVDFNPIKVSQLYCCANHQRILARRLYRERNAEWVRSYKLEKGCADCGYNEHHASLEFDHLEARNSDITKTIANMVGKQSLSKIKEEIAKCEVVCRNCHGIRTWNRLQNK